MVLFSSFQHTCVHDLRDTKFRNVMRTDAEDQPSTSQTAAGSSPKYLLTLAVDSTQPIDLTMRNNRSSTRRPDEAHGSRERSRSRSPLREEQRPSTSASTTRGDSSGGLRTTNLDHTQNEILSRMLPSAQQRLDSLAASYAQTNEQFMIFVQGGSDGVHQTLVLFADDKRNSGKRPYQVKNGKLMYYVVEPNMGRGFIKEPCFSYDGRIICSPFAHGVRLLSFDSDCRELEDKTEGQMPKKASELQEVASVYSHQNLVVATKYSPTTHLLVTGCLDGQVCFHQPML